jgi:type IV pilus assembly protein PilY1
VYASVQANSGWMFDFARTRARNITQAVVSDQSLVFTEYQPSGLKCQPEGFGFISAPHLQAGIPGDFAPLGTNTNSTSDAGGKEVNLSKSLGFGSPSAASIHQRGDGKKMAIVQNSTGELSSVVVETGTTKGARQSWRELDITW